MKTLKELHQLARDSTLEIRECSPLGSTLDNSSHYLACCGPDFIEVDSQQITIQNVRVRLLIHSYTIQLEPHICFFL